MKFEIDRGSFLHTVQSVIGVIERRQTMPILSNFLVEASETGLRLTGTDLELELVSHVEAEVSQTGETTVPARKLFDICRGLPEGARITCELSEGRFTVRSGRSRYTLATQPAAEYPRMGEIEGSERHQVPRDALAQVLARTQFAMAQQDVRYYLNGLLLCLRKSGLRAVGTDGHRLALSDYDTELALDDEQQVIVPRKGVVELSRLIGDDEDDVSLTLTGNHIQVDLGTILFTSKLIDGRFPDFEKVIPSGNDKVMVGDRETVRAALSRAAILSNEKFRGVRIVLEGNTLKLQTENPEHEQAEEEVEVDYGGSNLEIGFNVNYLLDALGVMTSDEFRFLLSSSDAGGLLKEVGSDAHAYVVMPMRL